MNKREIKQRDKAINEMQRQYSVMVEREARIGDLESKKAEIEDELDRLKHPTSIAYTHSKRADGTTWYRITLFDKETVPFTKRVLLEESSKENLRHKLYELWKCLNENYDDLRMVIE